MEILENYDLKNLNTFGISAKAKFFAEISSEEALKELMSSSEYKNNQKLILGGGSNILFTKDFDGIVIRNKLEGITLIKENEDHVWIKAMSGVIWHELVTFAVSKSLWGIENLSLIPGTVGGAPMQNIGAYGVELEKTLENVEAYDLASGEKRIFSKEECQLGYRDSIFKQEVKGKYFISAITLRLSKKDDRNISYKILKDHLEKNNITVESPKDISIAVSDIRRSKLPDPKVIGNAGSFFKNVFVAEEKLSELKKVFPELPSFQEGGTVKIPSGWLVEQCGWKGKRVGKVGVHDRQALVLVNYGGATGQEVYDLAQEIIKCVYEKFGLTLVTEVNLI
jgi:UDP-N-acetylmuramate dehydrogenase